LYVFSLVFLKGVLEGGCVRILQNPCPFSPLIRRILPRSSLSWLRCMFARRLLYPS
jgi:hypothetical protein